MAELEHIGFFVKQLLNDIVKNYTKSYCCEILKAMISETQRELKLSEDDNDPVWKFDNECTKEQISQIIEECKLELILIIKECEDLIRADNNRPGD